MATGVKRPQANLRAIQSEVSTVGGDAFTVTGPLPTSFGLTVGTAGDPTLSGPDFRSAALSAASLPTDGSLRVEIVVGPTVRLEHRTWLGWLRRSRGPRCSFGGFGLQAELDVTRVEAAHRLGIVAARLLDV